MDQQDQIGKDNRWMRQSLRCDEIVLRDSYDAVFHLVSDAKSDQLISLLLLKMGQGLTGLVSSTKSNSSAMLWPISFSAG